jgi:predicted transcriptional regulator
MSEADSTNDVAALTVQLLSAYLANNTVASEDLAGLIRSTRDALTAEQAGAAQAEPEIVTPAVSVRKSLASPEHIISLIDGKPYKTLKRHLAKHGLTPDAYRSRYNLPSSYPIVAPAYTEHRRAVAQRTGLGGRRGARGETPTSQDDQIGADGAFDAEAHLAQPAPGPGNKQRRATAAKRSLGARSDKRSAAIEGTSSAPASDAKLAAEVETSSEAQIATDVQSSRTDSAVSLKEPADKKRSAKPVRSKSLGNERGKSKTGAAEPTEPATKASPAPDQADEQNVEGRAQKPKRRSRLGVFKKSDPKSDALAEGTATDGAEASSQSHEIASAATAAAVKAPAKRKSSKRMARSTVAPEDPQPSSSAASEDGSTK